MTTTDRALRWIAYGLAGLLVLSVVDVVVWVAAADPWRWDTWGWGWDGWGWDGFGGPGLVAAAALGVLPLVVGLVVVLAVLADRSRQRRSSS